MSGDDQSTDTVLSKVCYILSCVAILIVVATSLFVFAVMIKHRTLCDTDWRVKTVLMAYPLFGMLLCAFVVISNVFKVEIENTLDVFMSIACVWTCVHWQVTIYYLRTACLLKVSFN